MKDLPIAGEATVCSCDTCKSMCTRPCWPTREEAQKLVEEGYGKSLMLDYWSGDGFNGGNIYVLSPALKGCENGFAPSWPRGQCTFQDLQGLCKLHDLGLKPVEGRLASCDGRNPNLHRDVAMSWNNAEDQAFAERWYDER